MTDVDASRPWWLEAVMELETAANDAERMAVWEHRIEMLVPKLKRKAASLRKAAAVLRATPEPK